MGTGLGGDMHSLHSKAGVLDIRNSLTGFSFKIEKLRAWDSNKRI